MGALSSKAPKLCSGWDSARPFHDLATLGGLPRQDHRFWHCVNVLLCIFSSERRSEVASVGQSVSDGPGARLLDVLRVTEVAEIFSEH